MSGNAAEGARTSFSLSAGGTSLYDSANIFAALPRDGDHGLVVGAAAERSTSTSWAGSITR